ncbi:hypothetical protein PV517_38825 [Streptomyces griseiscabiei]|uniref:Uncharacterized protein n=1 Tax=Streptomyces griseiscabiei TaxID=2993540 RepID=A0ABU4LG79_9ACTN|nr:hypothetical protein [Streptomyces griseiscabiei]MDX2914613.1 hypothetical protein [Streptomyces griseiscabiei]
MTMVGTLSVDMFCEGEKGARATAALSEGLCSVAQTTPPPPME